MLPFGSKRNIQETLMKTQIFILTILCLLSCKEKSQKNSENVEVADTEKSMVESDGLRLTVVKIDSLISNKILSEIKYPNMSTCGGSLSGFYYKNKLVFIDATYSGELSYTRKKMYLSNSGFSKVIYQEHFPEMDKYRKKYPLEKYDFDPSKVTFADTIYEINIGQKNGFKKIYLNEVLSTETDSTLITKLLVCGERMKTELKSVTE